MNARDLLLESQKAFAQNQNLSQSESITYKWADNTSEETNSNIVDGSFDEKIKSYNKNLRQFRDIVLSKEPARGDVILYLDEIWQVLSSQGSRGIYLVTAEAGVKFTMGKKNKPVSI